MNPINAINSSNSSGALTPRYVVITPVRNEARYIGKTIESMVHQTILPQEWIIVNDGSTDRTPQIIDETARQYPWIRVITLPRRAIHSFAAVVHAIEAGVRAITVKGYDYLGLLDSDVRFQPDYFEKVIERFEANPGLGLGGGMVVDPGRRKTRLPRNQEDVPGAAQFFRRECFEALGPLIPVPEGGWDTLTCVRARMTGYRTRLFTDIIVEHMKPRNSCMGGRLRRLSQMGQRDYALGYQLVFELFKCAGRLTDSPAVLGAVVWLAGYLAAKLSCKRVFVRGDLLHYMRAEQMRRLRKALCLPFWDIPSLASRSQ